MGKIFANKREKVGNTMSILGIENRTENWKTARAFAPFFTNENARFQLAERLLGPLGKTLDCQREEVKLELFWNGVRDYFQILKVQKCEIPDEVKVSDYFKDLFPSLKQDIEEFSRLSDPTGINYDVSTPEGKRKLWTNLHGTELDIVLKAPGYLLVGEAKQESRFGSDSKGVLVHQLVRQFVTANILVRLMQDRGLAKNVYTVPFVVCDKPAQLKTRHQQVRFMIEQGEKLPKLGWLHTENILSWDDIEELASPT